MCQKKVTAKQAQTKLRQPQTNIEMPVDDFLSLTCGPAAGPDVCSPMVAITDHNDNITAVFSINLSKLPKSFQNVQRQTARSQPNQNEMYIEKADLSALNWYIFHLEYERFSVSASF